MPWFVVWLVVWPLLMQSARWIGAGARAAPIRAMAAEAVKRKRADARAKAKPSQQGCPSPQPLDVTGDGVAPLTAVGEVTTGGRRRGRGQLLLNLKTQKPEDPETHPLFNPAIMALGLRLVVSGLCVAGLRLRCLFGINAGELYSHVTTGTRYTRCN